MIPQALKILFGGLFTFLTAVALGKLLLRGLKLRFYRTEETLLAYMAGSACLSGIVFVLTAAQLARTGVFLAVGVLAIGLALRRGLLRDVGEPLPALPPFWKHFFGLIFTVFLLAYCLNAMLPESSPDGSTYHLGLVARYLREHGFKRITTNMYANLSQGVEMLYLYAFAFGRHSAAALVHFSFLATLPLAMLAYARRFGFPAAGAAGALLFFVSPVVGRDGTTAYNDVAVAAIVFAVFYLIQIWDQERSSALFVPIGLMAGFCYAAKYTTFLAVPYALGFVGWKLIRARKPFLKPLFVISFCALLLMAPWMVKNWIWLDNPFSPFLNQAFPNPNVHVSFEREYVQNMRNSDGVKLDRELPLEVTVRGRRLCGLFGPVFLLAPIALFALRQRAGRRLLLAALIFGSTYFLNIGTRFLIPAAPYVSLAMGLAVARARGVAPLLVIAHVVASWPSNIHLYYDQWTWQIEQPFPWKQALRIESEEAWLNRSMPSYAIARMIERRVPKGERVFVTNGVAEAYTTRDILVGYQAAFNNALYDVLFTPIYGDFHPRRHAVFRFPAERLRAVRVVQTAGWNPEHWSVNEFFVLNGDQEVKRTHTWTLRAHPNTWDAELAFDRNLATRWRSFWTLFPGMYLEAAFGRPETVDTVRLEYIFGQYFSRMRLEGQTESGQWKTLDREPEMILADDMQGLRRAAVAAFLTHRVQWIVLNDSDYAADDLKTKIAEWGITLVEQVNGARLYRLY
jgi:hypothetical protein